MGLYTKIKGDMEFTNVGTPTITDGIVSGFTSSSYIKTNMPFYSNNKTWEFIFKIKFNILSGRTTIVGDVNVNDSCIQLGTNGTHLITYMSSKGTSTWDIGRAITGTYTLLTDTYYYIKYEFTGTQYKASVSTDKITWTTDITINSSLIVFQGKHLSLGYNNGSYPEPLQGEIDLNETTLKIGNNIWFGTEFSKVKIKTGLTNYTVIGNPTIENGIISNFSSSNYLTLPQLNSQGLKSIEFGFYLINIGNQNYRQYFSMTNLSLCISNGGGVGINYDGSSYYNWNTPPATGEVLIKSILDIENSKLIISWTSDGVTYKTSTHQLSSEISINSIINIGKGGTSLIEAINLKKSYIKINDGYFWRGFNYQNINAWKIQQDNFSKYYTIVDGKLMWASPDIYLQSSAQQWINSGIKADQDTILKCKVTTIGSGNQSFFGTVDSNIIYGIGQQADQSLLFAQYYTNGSSRIRSTAGNDGIARIFELNKNKFYINNNLIGTFSEHTFTTTNTIKLFTLDPEGTLGNDKGYYFKIYKNDKLVRYFVPVPKGLLIGNFVVPSNGMFDIVEQKFYENKGTGDFVIGGIPSHYIIEGGKMIWCNPDIYLESTGTQYIETNHFANSGTLVEGSFQFTDTTVQQRVFGADSSYNTILYSLSIYINGSSKWAFSSNDGIGLWVSTNISKDTNKHTYKVGYPNGGYLYIDTTQSSKIGGTQNNTANQSLVVFADKKETGDISGFAKIKEWYFIIYQYSFIKQYLVPVPKGMLIGDKIAPSNCMFDMVTQTFFENQGTGDFIIGGLSGDYINVGDNIIWTDNNVYISNNGSNRWIDTGFIADKNNYSYIADIKFSGNSRQLMGFGGTSIEYWGIKNNTQFELSGSYINVTSSNERVEAIFKWIYDDSTSPYYSMQCELTIGNSTVKKDNTQSSSSTAVVTNKRPYYLFKMWNYTSLYCNAKMYSHKVYNENNKLMQYLLPVNTDTVVGNFTVPAPGMWDAVTKKFYPNKGTGSFTYGKDE